ncbi:hypothetical protein E2C01_076168 [Portunus trituberculatus]|uniref:Uncharacterized protein n=1 Tax=Portunus trituberculatus TaxID=210409 RepID=A0A5B7IH46_PORTR|nr:hypothetical protein [Portunus trituberculatus]
MYGSVVVAEPGMSVLILHSVCEVTCQILGSYTALVACTPHRSITPPPPPSALTPDNTIHYTLSLLPTQIHQPTQPAGITTAHMRRRHHNHTGVSHYNYTGFTIITQELLAHTGVTSLHKRQYPHRRH